MGKLLWVDLEMTGLDETKEVILELAALVTDLDFNALDQLHHVVFQPQDALDRMDDWCKKTHGESGLTAKVKDGTPLPQVETELLALMDKHFAAKEQVLLAGNSIGNDRRFIDEYMTQVSKRLHYRMIDVSSFKEIFRLKYGIKFEKKNHHRAVDDILESIDELKAYLAYVQVGNTNTPTK